MATAKKDTAETKPPVKKRAAKKRTTKKRKAKSEQRAKKVQQLQQRPQQPTKLKKQLMSMVSKADAKTLLVIRERLMRATEFNCTNPESVPENITSAKTGIEISRHENLSICFELFNLLRATI